MLNYTVLVGKLTPKEAGAPPARHKEKNIRGSSTKLELITTQLSPFWNPLFRNPDATEFIDVRSWL